MLDLLHYLFPDLSQMLSGNPRSISAWFWVFIVAVFLISCVFLIRHNNNFKNRIKALRTLIDGQEKENLALNRREILQKAQSLKVAEVGDLWSEFDESLVLSPDKQKLFNTLDAEHFFNSRTLARGLTANRLLAATPSFLVAIGVLGTFVGLTIGLEGLVGSSNEIETLKGGIDKLISGAAVAFMTSVWGVLSSLLLNFLEKRTERNALQAIQKLQFDIDFLYPRIPAEQSLIHIAEYGKESKEALQELHERIGDRLQETLSGMSESMQTALADTLNNIMGPAIQTLVNSTNQQSSQAMEQLVGSFMKGMESTGQQQGQLMQQAAADVNSAVSEMTERLGSLFSKLNEQHESQQDSTADQNRRFEEQLSRMAESAEQRQMQLESRFQELLNSLTQQMSSQTGSLEQREQERSQQYERLQNELMEKQQKLLSRLSQTSEKHFSAMADATQQQQDEMQGTVNKMLADFGDQMKQHDEQSDNREQIRQTRFQEQLEAITTQQQELLSALTDSMLANQQQSRQMAEQHQQLLNTLQKTTESATQSSKHLDSSANQLGLLSANLRSASELLGQRMEEAASSIKLAGNQNAELADRIKQQANTLTELQKNLLEGAQHFEQAAREAHSGFGELKHTQQEFLSGVKSEFTDLGEALRAHVEAIEKQAEEWLRSYSSEVRSQIDDRMNKWNEVSLNYADKMLHTAQAINSILDELEAR
ncbi:anti-phage defense ZorAB system protein ZorA [Oceanimonas baumannii]|uniref:anti-phage ZorAB system protein ZorA n=1 Tax=Oceanimonas baumannii TaxID=129578 RepID=UPI001D18A993|nr:anti-phage ZorAB system protein ZorA [Oceanimonas baumannii]MCC4264418.1 anti-phage defense ZorAB system protein ZorA [Oceanimonas baumannii]